MMLGILFWVWLDLGGRAYLNGPTLHDLIQDRNVNAVAELNAMCDTLAKEWIAAPYEQAKAVDLQADLFLQPAPGVSFRGSTVGLLLPNGQYKMSFSGDLGTMELARSPVKKITIHHDQGMFSDQALPRHPNANLGSLQSLLQQKLFTLRQQLISSGQFERHYLGSGNFNGQLIHRIALQTRTTGATNRKAPIALNTLWTFWQSGTYELWIDQATHRPHALFFTNADHNIYANMTFLYNPEGLPALIELQNNSSGFEGRSEIALTFHPDNTMKSVDFSMENAQGLSLTFSAALSYQSQVSPFELLLIPPPQARKISPDQLKLLVLSQVAGQLLRLQQNGLRIRNFTF
jgi:hypothetical protein